jgi:hypothetical protein
MPALEATALDAAGLDVAALDAAALDVAALVVAAIAGIVEGTGSLTIDAGTVFSATG